MAKQNFGAIDGTPVLQQIAGTPDSDSSFILIRSSEHTKPTFKYAGNYTPVAAPTDSIMIQGSATKTLRIKRIALGGLCTTTAAVLSTTLVRRSTQFTTQGTAVFNAVTAGKMDTGDAVATGVVSTIGTANLTTVGTTAGNIGQGRLIQNLVTVAPVPLIFEFATRQDKALILRGILDFVFVNFNASALGTAGTIDYDIEIEEDAS